MSPDPHAAQSVRAWVGIGSNLDNPLAQVNRAILALAGLPDCTDLRCSSLYRTPPLGPAGQPDYINAVCCFSTRLSPEKLLEFLQGIENAQGRVRGHERWGPRTLDLDLLLYGNLRLNDQKLTIPHPGITQRAFVLLPMLELAQSHPDLTVPGAEMSVPGAEMSVPAGEVTVPGPGVSVPAGEVSAGEVSVPGAEVSVPGVWVEGVGELLGLVRGVDCRGVERVTKFEQREGGE